MSRYSWKMSKGRHFSADTYELRKDGIVHAVVQKSGSLWFSYGMGVSVWNTSGSPVSLDEAKKDAMSRAKTVESIK